MLNKEMRDAIKTAPKITIITSLFLKFSEEKTNPEKEKVTKKVTTNIAIATPLVIPLSSLFLLLFICKSFLKIYISRKIISLMKLKVKNDGKKRRIKSFFFDYNYKNKIIVPSPTHMKTKATKK